MAFIRNDNNEPDPVKTTSDNTLDAFWLATLWNYELLARTCMTVLLSSVSEAPHGLAYAHTKTVRHDSTTSSQTICNRPQCSLGLQRARQSRMVAEHPSR
jgi:hypothetical protein